MNALAVATVALGGWLTAPSTVYAQASDGTSSYEIATVSDLNVNYADEFRMLTPSVDYWLECVEPLDEPAPQTAAGQVFIPGIGLIELPNGVRCRLNEEEDEVGEGETETPFRPARQFLNNSRCTRPRRSDEPPIPIGPFSDSRSGGSLLLFALILVEKASENLAVASCAIPAPENPDRRPLRKPPYPPNVKLPEEPEGYTPSPRDEPGAPAGGSSDELDLSTTTVSGASITDPSPSDGGSNDAGEGISPSDLPYDPDLTTTVISGNSITDPAPSDGGSVNDVERPITPIDPSPSDGGSNDAGEGVSIDEGTTIPSDGAGSPLGEGIFNDARDDVLDPTHTILDNNILDPSPSDAGSKNAGGQGEVSGEIGIRRRNLPFTQFTTVDAVSGDRNVVPLGPSDANGIGGLITVTIPARRVRPEIYLGFVSYDADAVNRFDQAPGTQQVVASVGGTGAPFGLNDVTTFNTEYDSNSFELGARVGLDLFNDDQTRIGAFVGLHGEYRRTDIDIDYNTADATNSFNSYLNISEDTAIIRPTFGLTASHRPTRSLELDGRLELGPNAYVNRVRFDDCGSTDATGGSCNGGFFQSTARDRDLDWGLGGSFTAGVNFWLTQFVALRLFGEVVVDQQNQIVAPNSTPTGVTWNGQPLYRLRSQTTLSGGGGLIFKF
jgi:hypothetical protein